jgi:hypothetical protein
MVALQKQTAADFIAATVPPTTSAYMLGFYAAQLNEVYAPPFALRHDVKEYFRGYQAAIAACSFAETNAYLVSKGVAQ